MGLDTWFDLTKMTGQSGLGSRPLLSINTSTKWCFRTPAVVNIQNSQQNKRQETTERGISIKSAMPTNNARRLLTGIGTPKPTTVKIENQCKEGSFYVCKTQTSVDANKDVRRSDGAPDLPTMKAPRAGNVQAKACSE